MLTQSLLTSKESTEAYSQAIKLLKRKREDATKKAKREFKQTTPPNSPKEKASTPPSTPRNIEPIFIAMPMQFKRDQDQIVSFHIIGYQLPEDHKPHIFAVDFDPSHTLGEPGAQGAVYKAQRLSSEFSKDPRNLAILKYGTKPETAPDFENEVNVLAKLDRLFGYIAVPSSDNACLGQYLFSEFFQGDNLLDIAYRKVIPQPEEEYYPYNFSYEKRTLSTLEILKIAKYIFNEHAELYFTHRIYHRDLKTANIMIAKNFSGAKLIDFGTSCDIGYEDKTFKGSIGYQAPEMTDPLKLSADNPHKIRPFYSLRQELFSLGVILLELLSSFNYQEYIRKKVAQGKVALQTFTLNMEHVQEAFADILNLKKPDNDAPEQEKILWPLIAFIQQCVNHHPNARPSATDVENIAHRLDNLIHKAQALENLQQPQSAKKNVLRLNLAMTDEPSDDLTEKMRKLQVSEHRKSRDFKSADTSTLPHPDSEKMTEATAPNLASPNTPRAKKKKYRARASTLGDAASELNLNMMLEEATPSMGILSQEVAQIMRTKQPIVHRFAITQSPRSNGSTSPTLSTYRSPPSTPTSSARSDSSCHSSYEKKDSPLEKSLDYVLLESELSESSSAQEKKIKPEKKSPRKLSKGL